jgi:hypothetical protein
MCSVDDCDDCEPAASCEGLSAQQELRFFTSTPVPAIVVLQTANSSNISLRSNIPTQSPPSVAATLSQTRTSAAATTLSQSSSQQGISSSFSGSPTLPMLTASQMSSPSQQDVSTSLQSQSPSRSVELLPPSASSSLVPPTPSQSHALRASASGPVAPLNNASLQATPGTIDFVTTPAGTALLVVLIIFIVASAAIVLMLVAKVSTLKSELQQLKALSVAASVPAVPAMTTSPAFVAPATDSVPGALSFASGSPLSSRNDSKVYPERVRTTKSTHVLVSPSLSPIRAADRPPDAVSE